MKFMRVTSRIWVVAAVLILVVAGYCQQSSVAGNTDKPAVPPQAGPANLESALNGAVRTWKDPSAANLPPADIEPRAQELSKEGTKLFFQENRFDEGIEKIKAAITINPRIPSAYNMLWHYYGGMKRDLPTALNYLEQGIEHCPNSSGVHFDLGSVYSAMNRPRDAVKHFQAALDLGIEAKAPAYYNQGNQYQKLGQLDAAIAHWQKALAEDEKHLNARQNLVMALIETGDLESARAQAQRLAALDPDGKKGSWARQTLTEINSK